MAVEPPRGVAVDGKGGAQAGAVWGAGQGRPGQAQGGQGGAVSAASPGAALQLARCLGLPPGAPWTCPQVSSRAAVV